MLETSMAVPLRQFVQAHTMMSIVIFIPVLTTVVGQTSLLKAYLKFATSSVLTCKSASVQTVFGFISSSYRWDLLL